MKRTLSLISTVFVIYALTGCGSGTQTASVENNTPKAPVKDTAAKDKGIGKFKDLKLSPTLDESMVVGGSALYDSKCIACHKLSNEKLVGPGWGGIMDRRTPEWIMNFITNTNVMLDSDLVAQQLMVICTTRMPSQNLTDDQARSILEFMRKNSPKK
jgi:hypothetical protein